VRFGAQVFRNGAYHILWSMEPVTNAATSRVLR
jgi:hypothetical protein